jgi:eukaryotic-like serine/threonine-protein kinase
MPPPSAGAVGISYPNGSHTKYRRTKQLSSAVGDGILEPPSKPMERFGADSFGGRFTVLRRLGGGGMGIVYEAIDHRRNMRVALKSMRYADAGAIYQFKNEFRALADVTHPNLVVLHELLSHGEQVFFTMELVEGLDFLAYVRAGTESRDDAPTRPATPVGEEETLPTSAGARPAAPGCDYDRLRASLEQLARGISALHTAGKLHRDIKPSNVMVSNGRVVLLDFGLVTDVAREAVSQTGDRHIAGTADYMAPEQASASPLGKPADWYSVGVVIYEALTGRLPFSGPPLKVMVDKQQHEPPPPSQLVDGIPSDLEQLCIDLLRRTPDDRPGGREVMERLGARGELPPESHRSQASTAAPFFGRDPHLAALAGALSATERGRAVVMRVRGESGMGKTLLLRRFFEGLAERDVVSLSGRCYERESVPFKALDGVIDALSRHLRRLPRPEAEALMPRDAPALARIFPALTRVDAVAAAPGRAQPAPDPQVQQRRAFQALRELCGRIADRHPLVAWVDDLQWGDLDSAALLGELLRAPDPPPILLLLSYPRESADTEAFFEKMLGRAREHASAVEVRELEVGPLTAAEAELLALALLGPDDAQSRRLAATIAAESAGSPLFVDELVRHVHAGLHPANQAALRLEDVLLARIGGLPGDARRLLEIIAVAGRPIRRDAATLAGELFGELAGTALALLRTNRLTRTRRGPDLEEIEIYHERIRAIVLAQLSAADLAERHRQIALALGAARQADPEPLIVHYQGAGDLAKAGEAAAAAGDNATHALAFDKAADLYHLALELSKLDADEQRKLRWKLGDALANAGRGAAAAREYAAAAAGAREGDALELQRRAAEQLIRSGHIDEGLAMFRAVLTAIGATMPSTRARTLLSLLYRRARVRLRGLSFRERDTSQIAAKDLIRIDIFVSIALSLAFVDTFLGADFQARGLLLALDTGEPFRVARAIAAEAGFSATPGRPTHKRTDDLLAKARDMAARLRRPQATGLSMSATGMAAMLRGSWREGLEELDRAAEVYQNQCTGVFWELHMVQLYGLTCLVYLGEIKELSRRLPPLLQAAAARGDRYADTTLRTAPCHLADLARGDPAGARRSVEQGIAQWPRGQFLLQHHWTMLALGQIDLYEDRPDAAMRRIEEQWPALSRSLLLEVQIVRGEALHVRARAALALAQAGERKAALARRADRDGARLERIEADWTRPVGALVRAGAAALRGDERAAIDRLRAAVRDFDAAGMRLYAAAARRRHGELLGGVEGRALVAAADQFMMDQGIQDPGRMAQAIAPGFAARRELPAPGSP